MNFKKILHWVLIHSSLSESDRAGDWWGNHRGCFNVICSTKFTYFFAFYALVLFKHYFVKKWGPCFVVKNHDAGVKIYLSTLFEWSTANRYKGCTWSKRSKVTNWIFKFLRTFDVISLVLERTVIRQLKKIVKSNSFDRSISYKIDNTFLYNTLT